MLPPIVNRLSSDNGFQTFVGTSENPDKFGIFYGGEHIFWTIKAYVPKAAELIEKHLVQEGLVGGWLPVVRFVYPENEGTWSEMIAYAPMRLDNNNSTTQPVWFRVSRVENYQLKWCRYIDSYRPYPPRDYHSASQFYEDMLSMRDGWNRSLSGSMEINIPDPRITNMVRHSLVREMITRTGAWPHYGVQDMSWCYGCTVHDGFPDTYTANTAAMLQWGLLERAGEYTDNYLGKWVRDDASLVYRGPETSQYGQMLQVVAQYAQYSGDTELLLKHRKRLDAIANLLVAWHDEARKKSPDDPAYGIIAGQDEADCILSDKPDSYFKPYLSNNSEAARGLRDLGIVWERIGKEKHDTGLEKYGKNLESRAEIIWNDLQVSIGRCVVTTGNNVYLPTIAGDRQSTGESLEVRSYPELLYSGNLTRDQVNMIVNYTGARGLAGVPFLCFLGYGYGYSMVQYDYPREFLLGLYTFMAHGYSRGSWTATEGRFDYKNAYQFNAYCSPAQVIVPMLVRWMLVFEDPQSDTLWLTKTTPREWLADGKHIAVRGAPTRWGKVTCSIESHLKDGRIDAHVNLPENARSAAVQLRLRVPEGYRMKSVKVNGRYWKQFDRDQEVVTLPSQSTGKIAVNVSYVK